GRAFRGAGRGWWEFFPRRFRASDVSLSGGADGPGPEGGVPPVAASRRDRQLGGFLPPLQFEGGSRREIGSLVGLAFLVRTNHMGGVLDHFARLGLLSALKIGVAQEVHRVG